MPRVKVFVGKNSDQNGNKLEKKLEERPYYWFIANGDFDIVWSNVVVFILGHIFFAWAYYILFTEFPWRTWYWSK